MSTLNGRGKHRRKEERKIPRVVERKRIEPKPLGGGTAGEEKRAASESSMTIGENQIDGTRMFFPGKKEGAKQEKKGETTEVKGKGVEIKEEEEGKPRVALIEEPKGPAIAKEKLTEEGYTINIASFRDRGSAERLREELEEKGYEAFVEKASVPHKGIWYRVAVGRFSSREEALYFGRGLKEKGINFSFIRKIRGTKQ
jgi:cell division septation protein DedD